MSEYDTADAHVLCHQIGILNRRITELESDNDALKAENAELKERIAMLDVTAVYKSLGEMGYIEQVANFKAENAALQARIAELEAAQRWIPVSERLPDTKIVYDKFDVIVEFENIENGGTTRCVELVSYDYRNKSWNDDCGEYGFYPVAGVTHWRERPTPPEVQE